MRALLVTLVMCLSGAVAAEQSASAWQAVADASALAAEDPNAARESLQQLLLDEPDLHAAHYNLACLLMEDQPEDAVRHFSRATDAPIPAIVRDSWLNLALLHHHQGRLEQAVAAAEEALRLAPDDHDIMRTRDELRRLLLEAREQARLAALRPRLAEQSLPPAWESEAYTSTLLGSGGNGGPYEFSLDQSGLPAGLTLAENGIISGSPDPGTKGNHTVTVTVDDGEQKGPGKTSLTILPTPAITGDVLAAAFKDLAYEAQIGSEGFIKPKWSATGLPPGMEIHATEGSTSATLRGAPSADGSFTISVTVADNYHERSKDFELVVYPDGFAPAEQFLPPATAWHDYEYRLTVRGRPGTYTWSGASKGLQVSPEGEVSGQPQASGPLVIPVIITRDDGMQVETEVGLQVNDPPVVLTDQPLALTVGTPARAPLRAENGTGPLRWTLSAAPPPNLKVNPRGQVEGIPEAAGDYTLTVTVTDRWGASSEGTIPVQVSEPQDQQDQSQDQQGDEQQQGEDQQQQDGQQQGEDQQQQDGQQQQGDDQRSGDQNSQDQQQSGQEEQQEQPDGEQSGEQQSGDQESDDPNLAGEFSDEERAADAEEQAQRLDEAAARRWLQQLPEEPGGIQMFLLPDNQDTPTTKEPW